MKKNGEKNICLLPLIMWLVVIPLIVKEKYYPNPLSEYSWYSSEKMLGDFFLYYKSIFVTITGIFMLGILIWQISKMHRKNTSFVVEMKIFIPLVAYFFLTILSTLFSEYKYFCIHGMPDQFETIWNLLAYGIALFYCYYMVVIYRSEKPLMTLIFFGTALVGIICFLQYFKIDIYRMIYAGEGYSFTFPEGTVYGPFYNTNYVGFYTLLFVPLFVLLLLCYKDWKVKLISLVLTVFLLTAMIGANSITSVLALLAVTIFAILFLLCKNVHRSNILWLPIIGTVVLIGIACFIVLPRVSAYISASNTQGTNLENIFTYDDCVEIDYKRQKLYVSMEMVGSSMSFRLRDQDQKEVSWQMTDSGEGYTFYTINDERFDGITVTPALLAQNPNVYGLAIGIDGKEWCFSNQVAEDNTYYYYTDIGTLTKLTEDSVSPDFVPLEKMSSLASGRGYIWNKTFALLKQYILLGSGADTFALVFPNADFVDKYNNGYDGMVITKPHNLYLQIAVQTGVLSLICFLVFYLWYFISSLRLYFKQRLNNPLVITGFAIMLGTLGYMISGLANDSTITVAPLYWALMGIGIGINQRIRMDIIIRQRSKK